jgi:hypothetical protein
VEFRFDGANDDRRLSILPGVTKNRGVPNLTLVPKILLKIGFQSNQLAAKPLSRGHCLKTIARRKNI